MTLTLSSLSSSSSSSAAALRGRSVASPWKRVALWIRTHCTCNYKSLVLPTTAIKNCGRRPLSQQQQQQQQQKQLGQQYQDYHQQQQQQYVVFSWKLLVRVIAISLCIAFAGYRYAAYKVNTRVWVKSPINFIRRPCPEPEYTTVEQQQQQQDPQNSSSASARTKLKICITTLTDSKKAHASIFSLQRWGIRWRNFDSLLEMTWANKQAYAKKHGYFLFDESDSLDESRPPSWSKIKAAQRLLNEEACDWVFWLDADTVIMNSDITVESFLPADKYDLLITLEKNGSYNAGAWLLKNTAWSREYLNHWWNKEEFVRPKGISVSGDNDALKHYLVHEMPKEEFQAHIAVPARCTFNSVAKYLTPQEEADFKRHPEQLSQQFWYQNVNFYHQGDFVAHVAGRNNKIDTTAMLLPDAV